MRKWSKDKIKGETFMSDTLVIEIVDSNNEPRCSILWECGSGEMCKYSAYLAYAIGSLNDDSTMEEIIENIREVFPGIGIPREREFYIRSNLGMAEYTLSTQYADDLGLPNGNAYEGLLAVSQCSMDKFDSWANSLNWLYKKIGKKTPSFREGMNYLFKFLPLTIYRKRDTLEVPIPKYL